jgi:O-antigen ligase
MRAYTWRIVPFTALAICLIFVVFSKSATALVTFVIMAGLYLGFILLLRSKHAIQRLALSLALIFSAFFVVLFAGEYLYYSFFELIGKDPSFTGRTNIWAALIGLANERPLIGYGIGMAQDPSFLTRIHGALTFEVASTHNSFFDVLLNIGYPGAVILVVIMAIQLIGILLKRQYNVQERRQNALILSVIITMLIIGFTSGDVLIGRSMFWLYIFCGLLLAEYALKHAHRAHKLQTEA